MINAIIPTQCFSYENLQYPAIMGYTYGNITSIFEQYEARNQIAYIGSTKVVAGLRVRANSAFVDDLDLPASNHLPNTIDAFNTTTASPIFLYEDSSKQLIGVGLGMYRILCANNLYPGSYQSTPSETYDIDLENIVLIHSGGSLGGSAGTESVNSYFIACVVEEVKIGA